MSDLKGSMHLTSEVLTRSNWLLWRREVIMGMKRIHAYNILTGMETRPGTKTVPSQDNSRLLAAQSKLAQATVYHYEAMAATTAKPENLELQKTLTDAQI